MWRRTIPAASAPPSGSSSRSAVGVLRKVAPVMDERPQRRSRQMPNLPRPGCAGPAAVVSTCPPSLSPAPARRGDRGGGAALAAHRGPDRRREGLARGALRLRPAGLRGRALAQPAPEDRQEQRLPVHRRPLPVFDRAAGRLGAGKLDIFVGPGFLITLPNQPLRLVSYPFERCRQKEVRDQLFSRGFGYLLYRIVDDGFDDCFPMLRKIGNKPTRSSRRSSRPNSRRSSATSPTSRGRSQTSVR